MLPEIAHQPTLHNPFPQLAKIAVAPFFNTSEEPTLNGKQVALAYSAELQSVPGFEVVPVGVVEKAMLAHEIPLNGPSDARRLAQVLEVDALVIGTVTDYTPYYPPRMGMRVLWYSANPCFHPIPPGYGLPWGTPEEEGIPAPLVMEAEMALARAQLATQTPTYPEMPPTPPAARTLPGDGGAESDEGLNRTKVAAFTQIPPAAPPGSALSGQSLAGSATTLLPMPAADPGPSFPPDWPDPRGLIPAPPSAERPCCRPTDEPVLSHTRMYAGNDTHFTEALASYYHFLDDARFGGWQSFLERSDDFIRFCCHMHLWEMLSARGGAGETRVVWRWPAIR